MYLKKLSKNINLNNKIVKAKIIEVKGSSPNNLNDIILISKDTIFGTIGGGNLEYLVIDEAKKLLDKNLVNKIKDAKSPFTNRCATAQIFTDVSIGWRKLRIFSYR